MNTKIIEVNDENFKENILKKNGTFLVDFWAEWCSPCKVMSSILEEISNELSSRNVTIAKCNVSKNSIIPVEYDIKSIPTLLFFKNRKILFTKVGSISKEQLKNLIELNL